MRPGGPGTAYGKPVVSTVDIGRHNVKNGSSDEWQILWQALRNQGTRITGGVPFVYGRRLLRLS